MKMVISSIIFPEKHLPWKRAGVNTFCLKMVQSVIGEVKDCAEELRTACRISLSL